MPQKWFGSLVVLSLVAAVLFCRVPPTYGQSYDGTVGHSIGGGPPTGLRCEYLENPLGIDVRQPRFSWVLEHSHRGGELQSAYQILVAASPDLFTWKRATNGTVAR